MTMFKIKRGLESQLPSEILNGTIYFCTDTGNIFIDMDNQRKQISGEKALKDSEGNSIIDTYAKKDEVQGTTVTDDGEGNIILTNILIEEDTVIEEIDPTVPAWAKEPNKPTYTAEEVGALPNTTSIPNTLADLIDDATHRTVTDIEKDTWNAKSNFSGSYNDLTDKPAIPSTDGLATETYVDQKVAGIVDSSPEALNTLNELAAALGDDPNFATTVATQIGGKANVEHTHTKSEITDFPTSMPASDVSAWAKASTKPTYTATEVGARPNNWMPTATEVGALPNTTKIPSKVSDLTNDSGYLTSYTEIDPTVPTWAKQSNKPSYTASEVGAVAKVTSTDNAITRFNGTSGDVQNSKAYIDDNGNLTLDGTTIKINGAMTQVSSPTVIPAFINGKSADGLGYVNTSNLSVGSATKATQDGNGNNIVNTYAKKSDVSGSLQLTSKPTTSTVGKVGQFAVDTSTKKTYLCVAVSGSTYTWERVPTYKTVLVQELITATCDWTVPQVEGPIHVRAFGGGGGGYLNDGGSTSYGGGGGGGHMAVGSIDLSPGTIIRITIGSGGSVRSNGSATIIGDIVANGGSGAIDINGGNGGTGGGGGTWSNVKYGNGGNGTYGGGGGGSGPSKGSGSVPADRVGGSGGNGGTYGGGGGGGGSQGRSANATISATGTNGLGGQYGGDAGQNGTNTLNMKDIDFIGEGLAGLSATTYPVGDTDNYNGGVGGGGGYGGNGGNGGSSSKASSQSHRTSGGGGGGGGYGAKGGDGGNGDAVFVSYSGSGCLSGGGGGGGGYSGAGFAGGNNTSTSTNVVTGRGGGGGGYGINNYGCGGTGGSGKNGCCILTYYKAVLSEEA